MRRRDGATGLVIAIAVLLGCSNECDEVLIDEAVEYVNTHLDCEADSDCAVVRTGCTELPDSFCGQLAINRTGAESEKWKVMESELGDCGPRECATCAALLVPACTNGACRRLQ